MKNHKKCKSVLCPDYLNDISFEDEKCESFSIYLKVIGYGKKRPRNCEKMLSLMKNSANGTRN